MGNMIIKCKKNPEIYINSFIDFFRLIKASLTYDQISFGGSCAPPPICTPVSLTEASSISSATGFALFLSFLGGMSELYCTCNVRVHVVSMNISGACQKGTLIYIAT